MDRKYKEHLHWGVTAGLVILACLVFAFLIFQPGLVKGSIDTINSILAPISYGAILAYLFCPVYNRAFRFGIKLWNRAAGAFVLEKKEAGGADAHVEGDGPDGADAHGGGEESCGAGDTRGKGDGPGGADAHVEGESPSGAGAHGERMDAGAGAWDIGGKPTETDARDIPGKEAGATTGKTPPAHGAVGQNVKAVVAAGPNVRAVVAAATKTVAVSSVAGAKARASALRNRGRGVFGMFLGSVCSTGLLVLLSWGFVSLLYFQILPTIISLINSSPTYARRLAEMIQTLFADNPILEDRVMQLYNQSMEILYQWTTTDFLPSVEKIVGGVFSGVMTAITLVKNVFIGMIVMIYLLNIKARLAAQGKKIVYGVCSLKTANYIIAKVRMVHRVFGGFITGKIIDSLIIGVMCFIGLNIIKTPYIMLISVIVGVTNVVPFFGPFIGAIPSAILILIVNPGKCVPFLLFILLLQTFDGNVLGPRILGNTTGISSFWVLFSIIIFGGLLGPLGMVVGVPVFAVIYQVVDELVSNALERKELSKKTEDYQDLDFVEETKKQFVKKNKGP
ncbi:MAG: AI-2E family transporter [Lachnospiraceae bacterium]|jgi:predicted PurR-regulated permease PerM|nr:AI-2E family transporter [Lachnospiraceae bacterium]